tara:strand:- start:712 stop:2127 length:1416 start_codon:yes stop_codon:yes gene_type:complete
MNNKLISSELIVQSGITFGTSGARGLVTDFSTDISAAFAIAFISSIKENFDFNTVAIAIDNRPSSYCIAKACAAGLKQLNLDIVYYGVIPTPALAYKAMQDKVPCIMVTGSHIPFDRNGLKFYRPDGEITKIDEQAILNNKAEFSPILEINELEINGDASDTYIKRYADLFSANALLGKKIGIYEHSSAGRDLYKNLFEQLGAEVISLGRSDEFVPIDTEAVSEEDQQKALNWSKKYEFDAIFSTDGDGDRPLVADESGQWLRGDILGLLCSQLLYIDALAIPASCNTAIEVSGKFKKVIRTKIGSPYVIAEFDELSEKYQSVAGFEANGGYLLASDIKFKNKILKALPTRDALLPVFMLLTQEQSISKQLKVLPQRFTASDRIQNFSSDKSSLLIDKLTKNASEFLSQLNCETNYEVDTTDGLRITLDSSDVIHLRPSGNAPELRCYAESSTHTKAVKIVKDVLSLIAKK